MSLINNMLADLEERQAHLSEKQDLILTGLAPVNDDNFHISDRGPHRYRVMLLLLALSVILVSVYLLMPYVDIVRDNIQAPGSSTGNATDTMDIVDKTVGVVEPGTVVENAGPPVKAPATEPGNISLKMDLALPEQVGTVPGPDMRNDVVQEEGIPVRNTETTAVETILPSLAGYEVNYYEDVGTVLKLELTESVNHRVYSLNNPDRVVVEFDRGLTLPDVIPERFGNEGIVSGIRAYHSGGDTRTMIIFDLSERGVVDLSENKELASGSELTIYLSAGRNVEEVAGNNKATDEPETDSGEVVYKQKEGTISVVKNSKTSDQVFKNGISAYQHGKTREGLTQISLALEMEPTHIAARTTLINILISRNNIQDAMSALNDGIRLIPEQYDWLELKAKLLVKLNKIDDAIKTLLTAGPDVNQSPEYYAFLAALLQKQGRNEEAVVYYQNVVNVKDNNGIWWMGLAISLERIGQPEQAVNAYRNAISDNTISRDISDYIQNRLAVLSG